MKTTPAWAAIALLCAGAVVAEPAATTAASPTTTSAAPSCTASLITKLCDYIDPSPEFAVAGTNTSCWAYCDRNPPCSFLIFAAGNPYTGGGTCWVYPGETFDASAGSTDCGNPYLSVYDKPVCSGDGTATTSAGACAATASPSVIASVCDYPAPPDDCRNSCSASGSISQCLSQCAESESCSYVVYNPSNPSNTPYSSGSCWMYPNGTYDAKAAGTCSGEPEQFVYENKCPKPSPSKSSSSSATISASGTGTGSAGSGSGGSGSSGSSEGGSSEGGSGSGGSGSEADGANADSTTTSENMAPTALALVNPLAIGAAMLLWQGL